MASFEKIKNQRGNENIILNGYIYNKHRSSEVKTLWRCKNRKCSGMLEVDFLQQVKILKEHDHPEMGEDIFKLKISNKLKKSSNLHGSYQKLITNITKEIEESDIKFLPRYKSMRNKILNERKKFGGEKNILDDDIPLPLQKDLQGEMFLRIDSGINDVDRFLIFQTEKQNWALSQSLTWIVDCTFKFVPNNFYQLLTIHAKIFGKTIPAVFVLLKNKTQKIYEKAFLEIKKKLHNKKRFIIVDFERALKNSLERIFPESAVNGCLYHFSQSIWRSIQNLKISSLYYHDDSFRSKIRKILNLAFFPSDTIKNTYDHLKEIIILEGNYDLYHNFLNYFRKTYVGTDETEPIYPPKFWSCFERIQENQPRTINNVEAWHRSLDEKVRTPHPNMAKFIVFLQEESEKIRIFLSQSREGIMTLSSQKNFKKEHHLFTIISNHSLFSTEGYINAIDNVFIWKFE